MTGCAGPLTTHRYLSLTIRVVALTLPVDSTSRLTPGLCGGSPPPRGYQQREPFNNVHVSIQNIIVGLFAGAPRRRSDALAPAIAASGSRYLDHQYFVRCCLVQCPKARMRSSQSSGSRSPRRVECSGELHIRRLAHSSVVRESLNEAEGQGAAR